MDNLGYTLIEDPGIWSIIPPIIALALALITKEVIFSLIIGVLSGSVIYSLAMSLNPVEILNLTVSLFCHKLSDNSAMIIFLSLLGIIVVLVTKSGGSRAYGKWAANKFYKKSSAGIAASCLGIMIFIDDYFNCLTVGTVMKPATDHLQMSREKLAYIIDATAAPVCIIAPISSWAAAVITYFPKDAGNGMVAFLASIPMNLYALLTLYMVFYINIRKNADFGPMAYAEHICEKDNFFNTSDPDERRNDFIKDSGNNIGRISDLVIPIVILVVFSIISFLYIGDFWSVDSSAYMDMWIALNQADAGASLALGAFVSLILIFIYYLARGTMSFGQFFSYINQGIQNMVPANVILILAWSIGAVCKDLLNTGHFINDFIQQSGLPIQLLPAFLFIMACLLAFSTGTAWGTFSILIPIIIEICSAAAPELLITAMAATLSGSVFGDHASPISDTTILSSTGADCYHLAHVVTQAPYALTVAFCSFIGYLISGFTMSLGVVLSNIICLGTGFIILNILLLILPKIWPASKIKAVPTHFNSIS